MIRVIIVTYDFINIIHYKAYIFISKQAYYIYQKEISRWKVLLWERGIEQANSIMFEMSNWYQEKIVSC